MNNTHAYGNAKVSHIIKAMLDSIPEKKCVQQEYARNFDDTYQAVYRLRGGLLVCVELDYLSNHLVSQNGFVVRLDIRTDAFKTPRVGRKNITDSKIWRQPPAAKLLIRMEISHLLTNRVTSYQRSQSGMGTFGIDYTFGRAQALTYRLLKAGNQAASQVLDLDFEAEIERIRRISFA